METTMLKKVEPISFFYESSREMFAEIYLQYEPHSKSVIRMIPNDKSLHGFDAFNKRLKISCGLKMQFSDNLSIKNPDTRACYELMYKVVDIWFAFEHLLEVSKNEIPRTEPEKKFFRYADDVMNATRLAKVEYHFNNLMTQEITKESKWRQELYRLLANFRIKLGNKNLKDAMKDCMDQIKGKKPLQFNHLLALSFGLRNLFVHYGAVAAMGTKDYALKRRMYEVLHDCLILASFTLANEYARRILDKRDRLEDEVKTM
jgi:hypothetical protein